MTARDLLRAGAVGAVLGGALLAFGHVLDFNAWRAEETAGPGVGVTLHLAHLALVLAFVGVSTKLRRQRTLAAAIGVGGALAAGVVAAIHYVGLGQLVGLDASLLATYPPLVVIGALGVVAFIASLVALGIAITREGGNSEPFGSLLVLGTVLMFGGLLELGIFVQTVGAVVVGSSMVWYGVEMWVEAPTEEPVAEPARGRPAAAEITGELDAGSLAT